MVKQFLDFFCDRLFGKLPMSSPHRGGSSDGNICATIKSIFWEIDLREDNKFIPTWESFKNESVSIITVYSEDFLKGRFEDELWTFEEVVGRRFWQNIKEYQRDKSFPYETKGYTNPVLEYYGWDLYDNYYDNFHYS